MCSLLPKWKAVIRITDKISLIFSTGGAILNLYDGKMTSALAALDPRSSHKCIWIRAVKRKLWWSLHGVLKRFPIYNSKSESRHNCNDGSTSEAALCVLRSPHDTSPLQPSLKVMEGSTVSSSPSRSKASGDILDIFHTYRLNESFAEEVLQMLIKLQKIEPNTSKLPKVYRQSRQYVTGCAEWKFQPSSLQPCSFERRLRESFDP